MRQVLVADRLKAPRLPAVFQPCIDIVAKLAVTNNQAAVHRFIAHGESLGPKFAPSLPHSFYLMTTTLFGQAFLLLLLFSISTRLWLTVRHARHVGAHRPQVPPAFAETISLADHQKAADYTRAKCALAIWETLADGFLLLALTLGGALNAIALALQSSVGTGYLYGLALFAASGVLGAIMGLPFSVYRTFVLEARFGFNQTTWQLWLADGAKGLALGIALGAPLLLCALWLMAAMGEHWWLYVWAVWLGFNLLMLAIYPTFIAPLFNKFSPLDDAGLKERITTLLARCGFASSGLFVMDGSRRSSHGNAYFTGLGKAKRIVFFDTLLKHLQGPEIEAVLAHELGHFHFRHVIKRIALMALASLGLLRLLAWLMAQDWFYTGLGLQVGAGGTAMALLLFSLVMPVFLFPVAPLFSMLSRRDEFQADAYAVSHASGVDLIRALVKLYRDNAATLTPDPLYSLFHDSHPPASVRIAHIARIAQGQSPHAGQAA